MKLTYWVCPCLNDSEVYSIRRKTKKEAEAERKSYDGANSGAVGFPSYGPAAKVVMEYDSGFEMMQAMLGEGRGWGLVTNKTNGI